MRLITTLEELEALPKKAIVRDSGGNIFERWYVPGEAIRPPDGDWYGLGFQDQCWSAKTIGLPAHVLWPEEPTEFTDAQVEAAWRAGVRVYGDEDDTPGGRDLRAMRAALAAATTPTEEPK